MLKFLLVVILIGIATYATIRVIQRRGVLPPSRRSSAPRSSRPTRPMGPDDDDDFLRDLDRKRRHPERPEDPDTKSG